MKTRCLIIDDEPIAIKVIKKHLENFLNIEIVGECHNAIQAAECIHNKKIDLMFLDIQLPQITGLDFLKTLSNPPKVIITTAYRDYAVEGYEFDVLDYLLKPISLERFIKAMNKYFDLELKDTVEIRESKSDLEQELFIYVKENRKVQKVYLKDITYIESIKEYIRIHTNDRKIMTKFSLNKMDEKLPADCFIRIHNSYIVNIDKILSFSSSSVELSNIDLPISRSYKHSVFKALECDNNML